MRLRDLYEQTASPEQFGTLTHDLPARYVHLTHDDKMLASILKNGFDMKYFGHTGRKFNVPEITQNDPAGIYATDLAEYPDGRVRDFQPWVIFEMRGNPLGLVSRHAFFIDLARGYGYTGKALTKQLLRQGVSVVQNVREFVILDPGMIQIVDWKGRI